MVLLISYAVNLWPVHSVSSSSHQQPTLLTVPLNSPPCSSLTHYKLTFRLHYLFTALETESNNGHLSSSYMLCPFHVCNTHLILKAVLWSKKDPVCPSPQPTKSNHAKSIWLPEPEVLSTGSLSNKIPHISHFMSTPIFVCSLLKSHWTSSSSSLPQFPLLTNVCRCSSFWSNTQWTLFPISPIHFNVTSLEVNTLSLAVFFHASLILNSMTLHWTPLVVSTALLYDPHSKKQGPYQSYSALGPHSPAPFLGHSKCLFNK
jgi:hypothetical protein